MVFVVEYVHKNLSSNTGRVLFPFQITVILFTNPSAWAGYDTRSIFKRSLTGLN